MIFIVHPPKSDKYAVVWAKNSEDAKTEANAVLGSRDGVYKTWDVIPMTPEDAEVHISLKLG